MRRLLMKAEVTEIVGLSYQSIYNLMCEGRFPRSVVAGGKVACSAGRSPPGRRPL